MTPTDTARRQNSPPPQAEGFSREELGIASKFRRFVYIAVLFATAIAPPVFAKESMVSIFSKRYSDCLIIISDKYINQNESSEVIVKAAKHECSVGRKLLKEYISEDIDKSHAHEDDIYRHKLKSGILEKLELISENAAISHILNQRSKN